VDWYRGKANACAVQNIYQLGKVHVRAAVQRLDRAIIGTPYVTQGFGNFIDLRRFERVTQIKGTGPRIIEIRLNIIPLSAFCV
jgi:hypothetical protein